MKFKKWNSIENHYNEKNLYYIVNKMPEINSAKMVVTEKIHGANFSILSTKKGGTFFAKRSGVIEKDEKFYGYEEVFTRERYSELVKFLSQLSKKEGKSYQLYGELYGSNIQKGVFYGKEKNFRWYSLREEGKIIVPVLVDEIMKDFIDLKVPTIGIFDVDGDFISFIGKVESEFNSHLTPEEYEESNISEGVVITGYEEDFYLQKALVLIKKKNKEFLEKKSVKVVRGIKKLSKEVKEEVEEFVSYINENRTEGLFSKEGKLDDIREIGKYASLYFEDAFKDYEKENFTNWSNLVEADKKLVKKKVSSYIFIELKRSLGI